MKDKWIKLTNKELHKSYEIIGLKKAELEIKYVKDVCELEERINKAIELLEDRVHTTDVLENFAYLMDNVNKAVEMLKGEENE